MIAVKLLLKSAPGVIAISLRLTIVVGVICSGFTVRAPSDTVTCSLRAPIMSWKCSTGALPDAITVSWFIQPETAISRNRNGSSTL